MGCGLFVVWALLLCLSSVCAKAYTTKYPPGAFTLCYKHKVENRMYPKFILGTEEFYYHCPIRAPPGFPIVIL
ncbi:unnamed protein product [Cyprideis torosa]|uniref:Uncharacterized protein n=1 Tax=Cyprideis torosa TaxID=163714 RepID=A0A7R8W779_9CRUS|nr:unnamed protein product [Cyprideis torosa]CAG0881965.1 unnamed protein product [Cyprideis torosa]